MTPVRNSNRDLELLSQLLLGRDANSAGAANADSSDSEFMNYDGQALDAVYQLSRSDLEQLASLSQSNHVVLRVFRPLSELLAMAGKRHEALVAEETIEQETARIQHALGFLSSICSALQEGGCPAIVIKSLDHWPDLGSDLDLYTHGDARRVVELMKSHFGAHLAERSWGDRLANKWNFVVPGLPELVELHAGRLGQTGEQTEVTVSVSARARLVQILGHTFRVAAPEDRIVISTLQRMYRHFYIRLCDIVDNAKLVDRRLVDFEYLRALGTRAGLWEGIATYLVLVSEYVEGYRGFGLDLPALVRDSARKITAGDIVFRGQFLRVPIVPHSIALYASELKNFFMRGELRNGLRLSLMPGLATAALVEQKITGNDKGIW